MVETTTKVIDGKSVMVTQFPALPGLRMQLALAKFIGPAVGVLVGGDGTNKVTLDTDISAGFIGVALKTLTEKLDESGTITLIRQLLTSTRIDGKEISSDNDFNMTFAGNYMLLYKVLGYVIEVNRFFDFLTTGKAKDILTGIQNMSSPSSTQQ
jgi:hypothetical protein